MRIRESARLLPRLSVLIVHVLLLASFTHPTETLPVCSHTQRGSGCGVVGFLAWVGSLLLLASLAAYASLLLAPEPAVVGGSLADGPPAVLAHQRSGMRVKVPTRGRQSLNLFVVEHGDKHAQETVLLLHGLGSSSYTCVLIAPPLMGWGSSRRQSLKDLLCSEFPIPCFFSFLPTPRGRNNATMQRPARVVGCST